MNRYLCIHGHFYQPPRENAWLEAVELQDSAYPYHDWNERITQEGYAPNTASRLLDGERQIIDIVNNYAKISFNMGPTLLSWMENAMPEIYQAIIDADKQSMENFSRHGSAIAQVYNHMIMPLANARDKRTQVLWGINDFEYRFGRQPEGMWLPETAVDVETLEVLAEFDIKFTILAPHQAGRIRKIGDQQWQEVSGGKVDPKRPYLCRLPSGKEINLFFYDGPISREVGFSNLLDSGESFANRLTGAFTEADQEPQLVHIATDGETYGHHRPHGDMALAYCLYHIQSHNLARITNYGEYLEKFPPTYQVEIVENTSWSCVHGVERWKSDCGCNSGMHGDWNQAWRGPLRQALDWLRERLIQLYEKEMKSFGNHPWQVRDHFIEIVLNRDGENVRRFMSRHVGRELTSDQSIKFLRLLEMQRHAMLMYTSCGWFFDEISGIETTQVMQYAARAMQLAEETAGENPEPEFIKRLAAAPSNITELGNGATVYERFIQPARLDLLRVGSHYAVSSLFEEYPESVNIYCYSAGNKFYDKVTAGKMELGVGRARIRSTITWKESEISFAVVYLGGHILNGGVREFEDEESFNSMYKEIKNAFQKSDISEVIHLLDHHFGTHNYSLWHLFKDEQRKVFDQILVSVMEGVGAQYRQIYENDYTLLRAMQEMNIPIPKALITPVEYVLNTDLQKLLEADEMDLKELQNVIEEFNRLKISMDETKIGLVASRSVSSQMKTFQADPENLELIRKLKNTIQFLQSLPFALDLWEAQNIYFWVGRQHYEGMERRAEKGDDFARNWLLSFKEVGDHLKVRLQ